MKKLGKRAICFPGQGAQKRGMFKELYDKYQVVKRVFDIASNECGFDVANVCFENPNNVLDITQYTQPCILACDIAGYALLKENRIESDYMAGFSLGEYAAMYAAGCIGLEDVFRLVKLRANAMQKAVPLGSGGMMAVFSSNHDEIKKMCYEVKGIVQIANYNTSKQIVVAGENVALKALAELLNNRNIKCLKLPVSVPSHCELMSAVVPVLEEFINKITLMSPVVPIIMNYTGQATRDIDLIRKNILLQTIHPVKWYDSVRFLDRRSVTTFIECGPGNTLSKFIRQTIEGSRTFKVNNQISFEKVKRELI